MNELTVIELIEILKKADPKSSINVKKYSCGSTFTEELLGCEITVNDAGIVTLLMEYN